MAVTTSEPLAVRTAAPWSGAAVAAALVVLANLLLLAPLVALDLGVGIDNWSVVRDAGAIAGQPAYFGAYSYAGVLLWAAGASVALFAASVLGPGRDPPVRAVLVTGGLHMAVACLDDPYMLHESLARAGVPEAAVLAPYAGGMALVAGLAWRVRDRAPRGLLALALAALAGATAVDALPVTAPGRVLLEEGLKLTGISALAAFLVLLSRRALRPGAA